MKNIKLLFTFSTLLFCLATRSQSQLTNDGNFKIHNGANMSVFGNFINNGSFTDSAAMITLAGTSLQQIGGNSVTTFKNLTLNNAAGSYLSSNQSIAGQLNILSGNFTTTGYDFTLLSNQYRTANIAPVLGDITGNITMQRYISGQSGWRFLASPVTGVTIADWQDDFITSGFSGSNYPLNAFTSIYTYDETAAGIYDNGYLPATSTANALVPGTGYWCYLGPGPVTVDVTGPAAKFNQTFSVSYTPSGGLTQDGYMMLGNPYPSAIDWNSSAWTKTNINDAIYIWNPALQQYASWVAGVGTNGGSNVIASSQSFWIQSNAASPALNCTENVKVSANQPFIRPANNPVFSSIKLNLNGNGYSDECWMLFGAVATNHYDNAYDARKFYSDNNQVPSLASQDSTLADMAINSLPPVTHSVSIPVKTLVRATGIYTLSYDSNSTFDQFSCIVLEDLLTDIKTNLAAGATYTFFIEDTTSAARFLIHVAAAHHTEVIATTCNGFNDGVAVAKGKGFGPWTYNWINSANSVLKTTPATFNADTLNNLVAGQYYVTIADIGNTCGQVTGTVSITQPSPIIPSFTVNKDTLYAGGIDTLDVVNGSTGATGYQWDFGDRSPIVYSQNPGPHVYAYPGKYLVKLITGTGPCLDSLMRLVTVLDPDAVNIPESFSAMEVIVFPNPSDGEFSVRLKTDDFSVAQFDLFTLSGTIIYSTMLQQQTTQIVLPQIAKGIYLYQVRVKNAVISNGKLIRN
ncbi:MAG: T9SS type A sorting domain-containing protein [Bacteroidota bacterium]